MTAEKLIAITGITLANDERKSYSRIVAYFDVAVCGLIDLRGCALVRTSKDGLSFSEPHLGKDDPRKRVTIVDNSLRSAITAAAISTYKVLGGSDLPGWAMKDVASPSLPVEEIQQAAE